MFLEEIDSMWSSAAPRRTPAQLRLRNPAGEGAEVAGRRCGGLGQEGMLQKKEIYIYPSHQAVHERCSVTVSCVKQGRNLFFASVLTRLMSNI